ncbi:MAG: hypothetical protein GX968_08655 [Tissierellia bacterium]|nr:hypothetical protein [Tissierellia bacterium]
MLKRLILTLINGVALFMILMQHTITPKASKKTILFGVKVPEDAKYYPEVEDLYEGYEKVSQIIGIISLIILSVLVFYFEKITFQILSIFLYIGILFLIYLVFNYKARKIKRAKNWDKIGSQVTIVNKEDSLEFQSKTEDDLWIIGNIIYYNPEDPSLFVEKRYGTGWAINMGRTLGKLIFLLLIIGLAIGIIKLIKI